MKRKFYLFLLFVLFLTRFVESETIHGTVLVAGSDKTLPGVVVSIVETNQTATADVQGNFVITDIAPGLYTLRADAASFKTATQQIHVETGKVLTVQLEMALSPISENLVVTAGPSYQETLKTYQSTSSLSDVDLQEHLSGTLGETLKELPGVNMRDFGPGATRPVIRGFDGDRVLILQDGARTSDLSNQSGDHAVPIDPATVDKIEVIRGPATLLYGSNAIGGVVNAVSSDETQDTPQPGVDGNVRLEAGSNNKELAGNAHLDAGIGNWIFHFSGGGRNTEDYNSGEGEVLNSQSRTGTTKVGATYVAERFHLGASYGYDNLLYGIPLESQNSDDVITLALRRHAFKFDGTVKDLGIFQGLRFNGTVVSYAHDERNHGDVDTTFTNKTLESRVLLDQKSYDKLTGTIGFWALHGTTSALGEEILAPDTTQNTVSGFAFEELALGQNKVQFGARLEHTDYNPEPLSGRDPFPDRTFTGFSASTGIVHSFTSDTVVSANYALAYRAPGIEELYNHGPHDGTLAFEVGNPNLKRELGNNIDASIRHQSNRLQGEFDVFYARLQDFVFLAPTGEVDENSGFPIANYSQENARFTGYEASLNVSVTKSVWLKFGSDYVNAQLIDTDTPVPRIPPLRNRVGIEWHRSGLSVEPEFIVVSKQDRVFTNETETPGYHVFNFRGAYSWNTAHYTHTITAALTNATNEFYINHISFIKDRAPEQGRSFKLTYAFNFF
jgi:iron complex outermembrane recepter protein